MNITWLSYSAALNTPIWHCQKCNILRFPVLRLKGEPDQPQNLISCSLYHCRATLKISSNFWVILLRASQTNKQTQATEWKHCLLDEGNKYNYSITAPAENQTTAPVFCSATLTPHPSLPMKTLQRIAIKRLCMPSICSRLPSINK